MPLFIIALSTMEVNDFQPMKITPAYAGKRDGMANFSASFRDHPRLCGEKLFAFQRCQPLGGSPPPMRGKGVSVVYDNGAIGITPAYAGKS